MRSRLSYFCESQREEQDHLAWSADRVPHEIAAYEAELRCTLVAVDAIEAP